MKYKIIIFLFFLVSCVQNQDNLNLKPPFSSQGLALIYSEIDFKNNVITKKLNNSYLEISHNKLKPGTLLKVTNLKTNDSITLKNAKRSDYPEFYKLVMTELVAKKINLNLEQPFIEIVEVKRNKSFVAKKTKIFQEEKKIYSNAPIQSVKIDNISSIPKKKKLINREKIYIIIAEFYSNKSAINLKNRIIKELSTFNSKKLFIKSKNINKITLLSGPYDTINLMKNDYIQLKKFGFEELDVSINE